MFNRRNAMSSNTQHTHAHTRLESIDTKGRGRRFSLDVIDRWSPSGALCHDPRRHAVIAHVPPEKGAVVAVLCHDALHILPRGGDVAALLLKPLHKLSVRGGGCRAAIRASISMAALFHCRAGFAGRFEMP